ncbi:hypothetical protein F3Y22_tig00111402pilonHSYRG00903 [Hibiscus syriacus]|uniref:Reverse transcriptase domain-containing protein n=1 Tax=Hibiscus syriacus TaxID=106335 RepID=A0A6A2YGR7_HIBSY|nr:hypothetical protein F3Y22_tig00111402pilonHSYRG00903 [Hibiscus syriacus]
MWNGCRAPIDSLSSSPRFLHNKISLEENVAEDHCVIIQGRGFKYDHIDNKGLDSIKYSKKKSLKEIAMQNLQEKSSKHDKIHGENVTLMPRPYSLVEFPGCINYMAKDHKGCRFLQKIFDEGSCLDVQIILNEAADCSHSDQRTGAASEDLISLNTYEILLKAVGCTSLFDEVIIHDDAINFFKKLYTLETPPPGKFLLFGCFPNIDTNDAICLDRIPDTDEVKNALFAMSRLKSPGADGLHAQFFQKHWDIVGNSITRMIQSTFAGADIDLALNRTIIVLIYKVTSPSSFKEFRPISLCSTLYKFITKTVVRRFQHVLPRLISPNQTTFISGVKIDLEKAFDRLHWDFILDTLQDANFRCSDPTDHALYFFFDYATLVSNPNSFWVKLLCQKYKIFDLFPSSKGQTALTYGMPLQEFGLHLMASSLGQLVMDPLLAFGEWNWPLLHQLISPDAVPFIMNIHCPSSTIGTGFPWPIIFASISWQNHQQLGSSLPSTTIQEEVRWNHAPTRWVTLNTDGSVSAPFRTSAGSLIRDCQGNWEAFKLVTSPTAHLSPLAIVRAISQFTFKVWFVEFILIRPETNFPADFLAKMPPSIDGVTSILSTPPHGVAKFT